MIRTVLFLAVSLATGCNLFGATEEPVFDMGESEDADMAASDMGGDGGVDPDPDAGCEPEPADEFCFGQGKNCGLVSAEDNCGDEREVDCGTCAEGCGEFEENVCGCPCDIDGECYIDGEVNPENSCEICSPDDDSMGWTVEVGASCDDDNACTGASECSAAGECTPTDFAGCEAMSTECAASACDDASMSCVVTPIDDGTQCTDDGLTCTVDTCQSGECAHVPDDGFCVIDDSCFAAGDVNPENDCEACDPATATDSWSPRAAGDSCADGMGQSCTTGQCDGMGTCEVVLSPGNCFIDNACYGDGDTEPGNSCNVCDSGTSTSAWTPAQAGSTCNDGDGLSCTSGQCDGSGRCMAQLDPGNCLIGGTCYADGAADPGNPCVSCDAASSTGAFTNNDGASCPADFACTSGVCQGGQCQQQISTGCLIDSTCYAADDTNPMNSCEVCDPAASATTWTVLADGDSCGTGSCTCSAGTCLKANGTDCGA